MLRILSCMIWVFILSANQVFALSYIDDFSSDTLYNNVKEINISEAKLLETYIERYKENINTWYEKFQKPKSKIITDAEEILDLMSLRLGQIQETYIDGEIVEDLMNSIVKDLKFLNSRIKIYMQQEEEIYSEEVLKIRLQYALIGRKISWTLDQIVTRFTEVLIRKENLSKNEEEIVKVLVKIRNESSKLKNLWSTSFQTKEEMKNYVKKSIESIRQYIGKLKELTR